MFLKNKNQSLKINQVYQRHGRFLVGIPTHYVTPQYFIQVVIETRWQYFHIFSIAFMLSDAKRHKTEKHKQLEFWSLYVNSMLYWERFILYYIAWVQTVF